MTCTTPTSKRRSRASVFSIAVATVVLDSDQLTAWSAYASARVPGLGPASALAVAGHVLVRTTVTTRRKRTARLILRMTLYSSSTTDSSASWTRTGDPTLVADQVMCPFAP